MKATSLLLVSLTWAGLWWTPDQQGKRAFSRGDFIIAAEKFHDSQWRAAAFYRAGEFEKAAKAFALGNSPEAAFNQGNAWLMNGKYEAAIASYDRALSQRPDWKEARENRNLATARKNMTDTTGGDQGDQKLGADKIVFDKNQKNEGQDTEVNGSRAASSEQIQSLWLRRVQTRPADFLKAKFAYQHAEGGKP
jgi:Ca-activated chloride channel family protein